MLRKVFVAVVGPALVGGAVLVSLPVASAATPLTVLAGSTPATAPFPNDQFTVVDASQATGRRIALPTAGCGDRGRSLCDDLTLLNTLDGFDLQPRVTIPFSGPVDLLSVTPATVHLTRPDGTDVGGISQLVFDPATNTVAGLTDAFLSPQTTYTLVITNGVRAADGTPIDPCGNGCPSRSVSFTTMTSTNVLDGARAQLDSGSAYSDAGITDRRLAFDAVPGRSPSVFPAPGVQIARQDQVKSDPNAPGAFANSQVFNTAGSAAYLGFGSLRSPQYVDDQGFIAPVPTTSSPRPTRAAQIGVTMMAGAPSPVPGSCLKPVVFGPGFTRSKYDLFLSGDALPGRGTAVFATDPLGHAYGPLSTFTVTTGVGPLATVVKGSGFGRGHDLDGDGAIDNSEGVGPSYTVLKNPDGSVARDASGATIPDQPSPQALVGLRDGLIQTVIDNMALVRALELGVDVDGNGTVDTCTGPRSVSYYGQSFGGIYGTMLLGTDPEVQVGVANVPGGPVVDIARESGFRDNIARQLRANKPSLLNGGPGLNGFTEDEPLRLDPRVTDPRPGATALQDYGARGNWLERSGSPETYAPHLNAGGSFAAKRTLFQTAYTDGTVPNPTAGVLYRALGDYTKVWIYRNDRTPTYASNPHGFLLDPTIFGRNQGQQQVGDFLTSGGATVTDPDGPGSVWEQASGGTTNYPVQLDCLHYPDPQTGQQRTIAGMGTGVPDCPDRSGTVTSAVRASASPSSTATTSSSTSPGTSSGSGTGSGAGSGAGAGAGGSGLPCRTASLRVNTPTITASGLASVTVMGASPRSRIEVQAYSQNHAGTQSFVTDPDIDRSAVVDANGSASFADLRLVSNTRLRARQQGCAFGGSAVIGVRAQETLQVVRTGRLQYTFRGHSLPARPGGLIVGLYRIDRAACPVGAEPRDCGGEVLIGQGRAGVGSDVGPSAPGAGDFTIAVRLPAGQLNRRIAFVVKTGSDGQNIPGRSNTRLVALF